MNWIDENGDDITADGQEQIDYESCGLPFGVDPEIGVGE